MVGCPGWSVVVRLEGVLVVVVGDGAADRGADVGREGEVDAAPDPGICDLGDELGRAGVVPQFGTGRDAGHRQGEAGRTEEVLDGHGEAGTDAAVVGRVLGVVRGRYQGRPVGIGDGVRV